MTADEVLLIVKLANNRWPNSDPVPRDALDIWAEDLAEFEYADVRAAIAAIARTGEAFKPTSGQVRAKLMDLLCPQPTWGAVLNEIRKRADRRADPRCLPWSHPLVLKLVVAVGWTDICDSYRDDFGFEAGMRRTYETLQKRERDDMAAGLIAMPARLRLVGGTGDGS